MDSKERFKEKTVLLRDQRYLIETCVHKLNKCRCKRQLDLLFRVLQLQSDWSEIHTSPLQRPPMNGTYSHMQTNKRYLFGQKITQWFILDYSFVRKHSHLNLTIICNIVSLLVVSGHCFQF